LKCWIRRDKYGAGPDSRTRLHLPVLESLVLELPRSERRLAGKRRLPIGRRMPSWMPSSPN
jgi:hypothetical protein